MNSVMLHGVLALAGLLFAYQTYTREAEQEEVPGQVTLLECAPGELTKLELESATQLLSVAPKKGSEKVDYWITAAKKKKPEEKKPEEKKPEEKKPDDKPADAANGKSDAAQDAKAALAKNAKPGEKQPEKPGDKPADKPPEPPKPEPEKPARPLDSDAPLTFLSNQKFDDSLKLLAPLRAMRRLGEIPKSKFDQFGLDKVDTYLRMECGGRKIALDVGGRTFGAGDRYARDPKTKQSYLLNGQILTDLESAKYKFMQNDLNRFELGEVDQATVKALGKDRRLSHRNRLSKEEARWVDASTPDKRNELFNTWFQRVSRLKAKSYLPDGAEPGSDLQIEASGSEPVVTIEYKLEGKPKGKLELVRVDTKQGGFYYARTETTKRWVALYDSLAKQVEEDVAMVVGAEEQPEEKSAPDQKAGSASPGSPHKPDSTPASPQALPPGHPAIPH